MPTFAYNRKSFTHEIMQAKQATQNVVASGLLIKIIVHIIQLLHHFALLTSVNSWECVQNVSQKSLSIFFLPKKEEAE